jgi:predicted MFS family arabinose efflux permease
MAGAWGWRAAYAVLGGGTALAALIGTAALPPLRHPPAKASHLLAGWRQLLSQPAARGLLLGDALTGTAWGGFLTYLGPFFGVVYAMRSSAIGAMLSLASFIGVSGIMCAAPLAPRLGARRLLFASSGLGAVAIMLPLSAKLTPILSLAVLAPYIFLSCVRFPTSGTIALSLLPTARGTMMAARGFTVAVAGMMGSLTCALLFTLGGFGTIGMGCAVLTVAGAYTYARSLTEGSLPAASPTR